MERGFYSLDDDNEAQDEQRVQAERAEMALEAAAERPPQNITIVVQEPVPGGAVKFDGGKAPIYQGFLARFPRAIKAVANVSAYGFAKYGTFDGWEKVPNAIKRYTDAKARHATLQEIEGPYDIHDSGLAHAAQEAWGAFARLELLLQQGLVKDMTGNIIKDGKPVLGTAKEAS
jgi:hypothetical protein